MLLSFKDFLFSQGGYTPHGFCIAWDPVVLWMHIGSDLIVALSYFAIPGLILVFLRRRRDATLHRPAILFAAFITACGITHVMGIVTLYWPLYGLQGVLKAATAAISLLTAVALIRMLPEALKIPSPGQLIRALDRTRAEVAERRQAEAALRDSQDELARQNAELEHANRELREFAYAASHDLKSPANTLGMWLEDFTLEHGDDLDGSAREALDDAAHLVERMRSLVEDVLCFSRVVNSDPDDIAPVPLDAVAADALANLGEDVRRTGAVIDIGPLPVVQGHRVLLTMLMQNLVANALKFRDPGAVPEVRIRGVETPAGAVISVRDNGIGIPPEQHSRIFSMFQRLHHRDSYPGTGLGLSLCRRIAVTHGATIDLTSLPGEGAEFRITFQKGDFRAAAAA